MKDLTIDLGECILNLRVGGIITKNERILICKLKNTNWWFLPGGRIKEQEDSKEALTRELNEEVGNHFSIKGIKVSSENFFNNGKKTNHEICFYYHVEWLGDEETEVMKNAEEEFRWINRQEMPMIDIQPKFIKEYIMKKENEYKHIISKNE